MSPPRPHIATFIKAVRNYDSTEWEQFAWEWVAGLEDKYKEVKRMGGTGDLGLDVVGFESALKFEGVWDNYQCKHYQGGLQPSRGVPDVIKIVVNSWLGKFKLPPRRSSFAAPRGVTTDFSDLLGNPSKLRHYVLDNWKSMAGAAGIKEPLEGPLKQYVEGFDYSRFGWYSVEEMLTDHSKTAFWAKRFGGALPAYPPGVTPEEIGPTESKYVAALLAAYAERQGATFSQASDLPPTSEWPKNLRMQRERFYEAESFVRAYRDQTEPGTVEDFAEQVHDGIEPTVSAQHKDGVERLHATLEQASALTPANVLTPNAKPKVKQGVCHQLANDERVTWVKKRP